MLMDHVFVSKCVQHQAVWVKFLISNNVNICSFPVLFHFCNYFIIYDFWLLTKGFGALHDLGYYFNAFSFVTAEC